MANNEILLKLRGVSDFSDIQNNVKALQNYFSKLSLPKDATKGLDKGLEDLDRELQKFQLHLNSGFKTKGDVTGLEKSGKKIIQLFSNIENVIEGIDTGDLKRAFQIDTSELIEAKAVVDQLKNELSGKIDADIKLDIDGQEKIVNLKKSIDELFKNSKAKQRLIDFKDVINSGDIEAAKKQLASLGTYADKSFGKNSVKGAAFKAALSDISLALENMDDGDSFAELAQRIKQAQEVVDKIETSFDEMRESAAGAVRDGIKGMSQGLREYEKNAEQAAQTQKNLNSQFSAIKDQVTHYFSLINAAQLLRRAFQDVYSTVKELDAVMTETAVVTDFSVGDMWESLPEYTKQAKALGVATKDLYAATTLYYQQGLKSEAAMAAGVETMKMAKIAGMESAAATDAMTAALRGFNMEVNETNAQRVNDVYSKLAAITASDTEEIATAMSKTASIASAVGAEFENIAVFLAQGIETTRESADSIGTALKTVLARFNELTKDPLEIGEVDGEIVDANKVEKALRSVGIALRDTNGQFRDADQVLLEVAQKWDSMSVMQQRYIATQAAGSRQQSRFIAMMSDYNRTMELQTAAYNAQGAAQSQYQKTLDSLESKMAKLKDAWDEFILGVVNNEVIKIAVDALSGLLDIMNRLTSSSSGLVSGISKIFVAVNLFKGAKAIFNHFIDQISQAFLQAGREAGASFKTGLDSGLSKMKKNIPIIGTISQQTKKLSQTIKELQAHSKTSKISLGNFADALNKVGTEARKLATVDLEKQIFGSLEKKLKDMGSNLTSEGKDWAQDLINGFVLRLNSGEDVDAALDDFQNKINKGRENSKYFESIPQGRVGVDDFSIDPTQGLKDLNEKNYEKKIEGISTALTSVGMVMTAIGDKLTELNGTVGKFGDALSFIGGGAATAGMTMSTLSSSAKALGVSLSTGPLIAITAVATALSLVVSAFERYQERTEAVRKQRMEAAQEANQETEANRELYKSLEETLQGYEDGVSSREDVAEASEELVEKYGLESLMVKDLTNDYKGLTKAIKESRIEEEAENIRKQKGAKTAARQQIFSNGLLDLMTVEPFFLSDELSDSSELDSKTSKLLEEFKLDEVVKITENGMLSAVKGWSNLTDQELSSLRGFLAEYLSYYGDALAKEGKKLESSEIYTSLQEILENTTESFGQFDTALESYTESIVEYGRLLYEGTGEKITSRLGYLEERDNFTKMLIEKLGVDESVAQAAADSYFSSNSEMAKWFQAEKYVVEIEAKVDSKDLDAIGIYQKYLDGEIPPEVFLSYVVKIDFEETNTAEGINKAVGKTVVKNLTESSDTFFNAGKQIREYIAENFSIEDIDQSVLQDFETNLSVINDALPEGANLLEKWQQALSKGTVGITEFFADVQDQLNEVSLETTKKALDTFIYGVSDVDSFKEDYEILLEEIVDKNYGSELLTEVVRIASIPTAVQKIELENLVTENIIDKDDLNDVRRLINKASNISDLYGIDEKNMRRAYSLAAASSERQEKILLDRIKKITENTSNDVIDETKEYQKGLYGDTGKNYVTQDEKSGYLMYTPPSESDIDINAPIKEVYKAQSDYIDAQNAYDWAVQDFNEKVDDANTISFKEGVDAVKDVVHTLGLQGTLIGSISLIQQAVSDDDDDEGIEIIQDIKKKNKAKEEKEKKETVLLDKEAILYENKSKVEGKEIEIQNAVDKYNKELDEAKQRLEAFKNREGIIQNLEINAEIKNAHQIAEFENQLTRIKELTSGENIVDFEVFKQLQQIMPELTAQATYAGNGMFDISEGMAAITKKEQEYADGIKESTEAKLKKELAEEQTYYNSLLRIRDLLEQNINSSEVQEGLSNELTKVVGDDQYRQAKAADQASDDASKASNESTTNILEDISAIDVAYEQLGKTISQVHDAILNLGNKDYKVKIETHVTQTNEDATNETNVDKTLYDLTEDTNFDKFIEDLRDNQDILNAFKDSINKAILNSENRIGTLQEALGLLGDSTSLDSDGDGALKVLENVDSLYNLLKQIDALQNKRKTLEKEYDNLLKDEDSTLEDIQKKQKELIANLYKELVLQELLKESRLQQIRSEQESNSDLNKYVWYDEQIGAVQINEELINKEKDEELREQIDKRKSDFEKWSKDIESAENKSFEYEQQLKELLDQGKTSLDESVNMIEKINEVEKKRSSLEQQYNKLLNDRKASQEQLYDILVKQSEAYKDQIQYQTQLAEEKRNQYEKFMEENSDITLYYSYDKLTGEHLVDWDAINALGNQAVIDFITDKIENAIELEEDMEEANESLSKIQYEASEYYKNQRKGQIDFFNRIRDAIVAERQREIDELSTINDSINDANSQLIDSIQKSLDDYREARENERTEEEISNKEARLAYLQADTTGANDLEIKNLQKELQEQKEDYTDTLIDQKISNLQQQNDEAAEQRERQIELAQAQLEQYQESGEIWKAVDEYLKDPKKIWNLLRDVEGYASMSTQEKEEFDSAIKEGIANSNAANDNDNSLEAHKIAKGTVDILEINGEKKEAVYEGNNKVTVADEKGGKYTYSDASVLPSGEWAVDDNQIPEYTRNPEYEIKAEDARMALRISSGIASPDENGLKDPRFYDADGNGKITAEDARLLLRLSGQLEEDNTIGISWYTSADLDRISKILSNEITPTNLDLLDYDFNKDGIIGAADWRALAKMDYINETIIKPSWLSQNGINEMPPSGVNINEWYKKWQGVKFKTGGLADFTGLAWLDGTTSRPEMVLNARDTENFIQLKDILSSVLHNLGSRKESEKTGDMYYEIHIDVEKLTSDYDVDDVANRVKTIISQDAMYRNTNIINRLR